MVNVAIDPEGTEIGVIHELVDFSGKTVLEVGCGNGRMTWRYAEQTASVLALDSKEKEIQQANGNSPAALRPKVRFMVADITDPELELPQDAFEVAILSHSL